MLNNQILAICMLLIVVALNTVKTETPAEIQPHNQPVLQSSNPKLRRAKRMYALCPPEFLKIGNECYFISKKQESWLDAHFDCKDRNSKLAEPLKFADRRLRKYLKSRDQRAPGEKWIGGMYNWQTGNWQYGYNGGEMKYQGFDENIQRDNLQFHCTAMDPNVEFKWTAKQCTERHFFICQHRMSFVNEKNRHKVYSKWNETYPNQVANEVEVYVSTNGNNNRSNMYRKRSRVNRLNSANNGRDLQQQKIDLTTTTTSAPDYLPYNAYKNLETMDQKPQEDIHSQLSALQPEQQTALKQRKRHSRPIKISGDVDLGMNFNQRNQRRRQKNRKTTTTELPQEQHENKIHQHNHHHHPNNALPEPELEKIDEETSAPSFIVGETLTSSTTTDAPMEKSELKKKLEEKALRRERLKAKLAQLTPEERQAFLLMKQQRADARQKGLSYAKST